LSMKPLDKLNVLAIDTETCGLYGTLHRLGILNADGKKVWLTLEQAKVQKQWRKMVNAADVVVGHNLKYDAHILKRDVDFELPWSKVYDTMVMAAMIVPVDKAKDLLALSIAYVDGYEGDEDVVLDDYTKSHKLVGKMKGRFDQIPDTILRPYTMRQLLNTLCLFAYFYPNMPECFEARERGLTEVLFACEWRGFPIDTKTLTKAKDELEAEMAVRSKRIRKAIDFEVGAKGWTKWLQVKLLKMEVAEGLSFERTPGGNREPQISTAEDVLAPYVDRYPFIADYAAYKYAQKLAGTYINGILSHMGPDGCVHTSLSSTSTRTGRLSSSEPNLQNITGKDTQSTAAFVRRAFLGRKGFVTTGIDYRQLEFRLAACLSHDLAGMAEIDQGFDMHTATAANVVAYKDHGGPIPYDQVDKPLRTLGKRFNFAIIYGMGVAKLAVSLGITEQMARALKEQYFAHYSGIRRTIFQVMRQAKEQSCVYLPSGRRLRLPRTENYKAFNYLVQGGAAEIVKQAMIDVFALLRDCRSNLLLQIHDELIVEFANDEYKDLAPQVVRLMKAASEFPMDVEVVRWQGNWSRTRELKRLAAA